MESCGKENYSGLLNLRNGKSKRARKHEFCNFSNVRVFEIEAKGERKAKTASKRNLNEKVKNGANNNADSRPVDTKCVSQGKSTKDDAKVVKKR